MTSAPEVPLLAVKSPSEGLVYTGGTTFATRQSYECEHAKVMVKPSLK